MTGPHKTRPFEAIIADFRSVAREHGYALAEHGSQKRDYDLIACPWVAKAHAASTLVRALTKIDGVRLTHNAEDIDVQKPHGRRGWAFLLDGWRPRNEPYYIDLSVMPRKGTAA